MRLHLHRWACLLALLLATCGDERDSRMLVGVYTDLDEGELTGLDVHLLSAGVGTYRTQYFDVTAGCAKQDTGLRYLGSFEVERGDSETARIELIGYGDEMGVKQRKIAQRIDATFKSGMMTVEAQLMRGCLGVECVEEQSCDPMLGSCAALLPRSESSPPFANKGGTACLLARDSAPPLDDGPKTKAMIDASVDADVEGDAGDSRIASELARGDICGPGSVACAAGLSCVDGRCCDSPCDGTCNRCDLPGREGRCSPILLPADTAPSTLALDAVCEDLHVKIACRNASCSATCVESFASCDDELQVTGCETPLHTVDACSKCGDKCHYRFCGAERCEWHATNSPTTEDKQAPPRGALYATFLTWSTQDTVVRALGALVSPDVASSTMRFAIYDEDDFDPGFPFQLLRATASLPIVDNAESGLPKSATATRVEALLESPLELTSGKNYFLVIQVEQATTIYATKDASKRWVKTDFAYAEFPDYFPFGSTAEEGPLFSLYAIMTPH